MSERALPVNIQSFPSNRIFLPLRGRAIARRGGTKPKVSREMNSSAWEKGGAGGKKGEEGKVLFSGVLDIQRAKWNERDTNRFSKFADLDTPCLGKK